MTVRDDIIVDWQKSPRIITILAPSVSVTMQDLLDTLRDIEDSDYGMAFPYLVKATGKEDLGGGVFVGITLELQNAKVAFEPRQISIESGTVTTPDANGKILYDSTALFESAGVKAGDSIVNTTDGSTSTVLSVDSEYQLTTWPLKDGGDNEYGSGDAYKVWATIQCEVSGGNLVAIDDVGTPIPAIHPTVNTQVVRTSSSSATIAQLEIENIQRLIETQRKGHTGTGNIWYWDPYAGNDNNEGISPDYPLKTFAAAHGKCIDSNHDIIICQPGNTSGDTISDEIITISKNDVLVRGPGIGFRLIPTDNTQDTVTITGNGVELSSMYVSTAATGSNNAVTVNGGSSALLQHLRIENSSDNGIEISNSDLSFFNDIAVQDSGGDGILVSNNVSGLDIKNCQANGCTGAGINVNGTTIENLRLRGKGLVTGGNGTYGIYIGSGASYTMLDTESTAYNNGIENVVDNGVSTNYSGLDNIKNFEGAVWIDTGSSTTGTNYPRGTPSVPVNNLSDAKSIADSVGLKCFMLTGTITLDQSYAGWCIHGNSVVAADTVNLNGQDITGTFISKATIAGTMAGSDAIFSECIVSGLSGASCVIVDSEINGTISLGGSGASLTVSKSTTSGSVIVDMIGSNRIARLSIDGEIEVRNMDTSSYFSLGSSHGVLTIASSCVDGTVYVSGTCVVTDQSAGSTVINNASPSSVWAHDPSAITDSTSSAMLLRRTLGLIHENMFIDNTVYDASHQLTSCRVRVFKSKADCEAATNGGNPPSDPQHIAEWTQASVWGVETGELTTFRQVLQ